MGRLLTIARVELLRLLRDRSNLFFVLVLPLLLVVLIGASFGGGMTSRLGIVAPADDPAAEELTAALDDLDGFTVVEVADADALLAAVERNELTAGVVVPEGYSGALDQAQPATVRYLAQPGASTLSLQQVVEGVLATQSAGPSAAAAVTAATTADPAELVPVARQLAAERSGVEVRVTAVGGDELAREFAGLGRFDLGASSQLLLFTFLTALTGSASLIETRRLGVASRMLATPSRVATIVGGQAAGRIAVALFQALYIAVATVLLFRVDWGDPVASLAVIVLFSIAAGGAGMLVGALASNESQASGLGIGLGIGLAALGGSMAPLEIYPPVAQQVALATPHAWANLAMAEIVRRDGGIGDVLLELGVLALFAVGLLGLATWRLHRVLVR